MKGFFSFAIALAIIALILFVNVSSEKNSSVLRETNSALIEAESANMQRTILENNIDRIIFENLLLQALSQNFNSNSAKTAVNNNLVNYLQGKAKISSFIEDKEISLAELNENSTVIIVHRGTSIFADYTYTGGTLRNMLVRKTFGDKFGVEFLIPAGYTVRVII
ncbi:MAG: hypothetical protein AABW59_05170 [archaeon]